MENYTTYLTRIDQCSTKLVFCETDEGTISINVAVENPPSHPHPGWYTTVLNIKVAKDALHLCFEEIILLVKKWKIGRIMNLSKHPFVTLMIERMVAYRDDIENKSYEYT